jgi:phage tail-like protein
VSEPAPVIPLAPRRSDRATAKTSGSKSPDPVSELRFTVSIEGVTIGAFSECSGLTVEYETFEYQEGGEDRFTHKFRGRLKYPNLVLKRGVTHEDALLKWLFNQQDRTDRGAVKIALLGDDGAEVRSWAFAGAFPIKWQGPSLSAKSTNVATETLEIAHQGLLLQV